MTTRVVRTAVVLACIGFGAIEAAAGTATQIATGQNHVCALTTGGGVVCWGMNSFGQLGSGTTTFAGTQARVTPTPVTSLDSGVTAVAAGGSHTCALTDTESVLCWGDNYYGQLGDGTTTSRSTPTPVTGLSSGVSAIAVGGRHSCALTTAGGVVCWGYNASGQLGDGTTTNWLAPTPVAGLSSGVAAIAAGADHTCAVTTSGSVSCWGNNGSGRLGDGTTTNRSTPTVATGLSSGVAAVVAGGSHTCALTAGGGALCWGSNNSGRLGDGTTTNRWTPTAVSGLSSGVLTLAGGTFHTCARTSGGNVSCWGLNTSGQLGDGTTTARWTPAPVSGLGSGVAAVVAGSSHSCALTSTGGVMCWGSAAYGVLGDGTVSAKTTPTPVFSPGVTLAAIRVGLGHTCATTSSGAAACWGDNYFGQLGDGTTTLRTTPTTVSGLGSGVAAVSPGADHSCAVTAGGALKCWGRNFDGQLGDGTTTERWTPVDVTGLGSGVAAVAAGDSHTCALTTGGGVLCWGYNVDGRLGDATTTDRATPTPVSGLSSGVAAIAVGRNHSCALTLGGDVLCWGGNTTGQLGDGTYVSQRLVPTSVTGLASGAVASVGAMGGHTCAITTAGGLVCWGSNTSGQLGDGTTTNRVGPTPVTGLSTGVLALTLGVNHTCALRTGGGVTCWGNNWTGQLGDGTATARLTPTPVVGLQSGATAISAGEYATCAMTAVAGSTCWGDDYYGQLGTGRRRMSLTPLAVYGFGGTLTASAISPGVGPASGGTQLAITGTYVLEGATVTVGGVQVARSSVVNTETIVVATGPHAPGVVDVVVANPDGTSATLAGAFTYEPTPGTFDFSGDGKSDILWHHAGRGEVWLWGMDGASSTAQLHVRTLGEPGWEIRGLGDQTGDGKADVLWRNSLSGMLYLWTMNGSTIAAETYVGTVDPAYDIVGTGDYNGDGTSDILWRHLANGEVWVWLMNGPTPLGQTYVDTVDPGYVVQGSGDLNGDGKADLVWRHTTGGDVWVWLMNGATPTVSYVDTIAELEYRIVGVGDLTGDGKADLVWHHATRGEVWIWPMNGATVTSQSYVDTVPDTDYRIVGTGDYNGDGKADLLWHHATAGEVWVWLMNGATRLSANYVDSVPEVAYQIVKAR